MMLRAFSIALSSFALFFAPLLADEDVVISEFMAANDSTLVPNAVENTFGDWVELFNTGTEEVDLGGWHLSDDSSDPSRWTFPGNTLLGVGEFIIVFASGAGMPDANGNLTTNFKLSSGGDYLALIRPDLSVACEFGPSGTLFPEQSDDISYGLHPSSGAEVYFSTPTPGTANDASGIAQVSPLSVSPKRGYYETVQTISISSETPGAQIYYTTDGSSPLAPDGSPSASSQLYGAPLDFSSTVVLRAAATLTNYAATKVETHTYVLLDITGAAADGSDAEGLNDSFLSQTQPTGYADLASGEYDMNPTITQSTASPTGISGQSVAQAMLGSLRDIPTISIALPKEDFAGTNGIYTNPQSTGLDWERACSAEFIPALVDTRDDFQEDCGLRVQGTGSRFIDRSPKHSLSFRFRQQYGDGKLRHAIFPDSEVAEFNSIALRASYNNHWVHREQPQRERASMIRDQWMRESMRDMGHVDAGAGFHAHLFINGLYWGLHIIAERQDNTHYSQYNGEDEDLIDARNGADFVEGDSTAWDQMRAIAASGNWGDIQKVIDIDNYIDFQLLQRYGGNTDLTPIRNWRAAGGGPFSTPIEMRPWRLYSWDGEHTLSTPTLNFAPIDPMDIRDDLEAIPEYQQRFSDRAQMHLSGDGALTPTQCDERWMKYATEIDRAVIAESARWGDFRNAADPYNRDDWLTELNRLRDTYFPVRTENVITALQGADLYSEVDPPSLTIDGSLSEGGYLAPGSTLSAASSDGSIYYTTDGSDPLLPDGTINQDAISFAIGVEDVDYFSLQTSASKYLNDPAQPQSDSEVIVGNASYGAADWKHPDFNDSTWSPAVGLIGGTGATSISGHPTTTIIDIGASGSRHPTVYVRKEFTVSDASLVTELSFSLVRDDGVVIYLNGREVYRENVGDGNVSYSDYAASSSSPESAVIPFTHTPNPGDLIEGSNVIAIEVHNVSRSNADLGFDLGMSAKKTVIGGPAPITFNESSTVTARFFDGEEWSAPVQSTFLKEEPATAGTLAITEINYNPRPATLLEKNAAENVDLSDSSVFEFIELANIGANDLNLFGTQLIAGVDVQLGIEKVTPGERVVVARNPEALEVRYGSPLPFRIVGIYAQNLSNDGEQLTLSTASQDLIAELIYDDAQAWPSRPDGDSSTLEIIDLFGAANDPQNWRSSIAYHGTPGAVGIDSAQQIVINEVATNASGGNDFIELHNTSASDLDVSGWMLTDSKSTYASYLLPDTTVIPALNYLSIPASAFENPIQTTVSNYEGSSGFSPTTILSSAHGLTTGEVVTVSGYDGISDYNESFEVTVIDANRFSVDAIFLDNAAAKGTWIKGRTFGLSAARGDDLWLLETNDQGQPVAFIDHVEFMAARVDQTLGRWPDGGGHDELTTMTENSGGLENTGPLLGSTFISEVQYRHASPAMEFVELCNFSSASLPLENWKLRGGYDLDFTASHSIPSEGSVVIVSFDPVAEPAQASAFRNAYGIDASVILIGAALDGPLNDLSGTVRLLAPGIPPVGDPTFIPGISVDAVTYSGTAPWPNGPGQSLSRHVAPEFGHFSTSWFSTAPSPGEKGQEPLTYAEYALANSLGNELEDADGDGAANIIEFASGTNAKNAESFPLKFTNQGTLEFTVNLLAEGVILSLETSPDLEAWSAVNTSAGITSGSLQKQAASYDTTTASLLFYRLVTSAP